MLKLPLTTTDFITHTTESIMQFFSVSALAYMRGFVTSKHSSLIGWFNKCSIFEEKIFDERMSRTYRKAFEKRQECDYGLLQELDRAQVMKDFDEAREFITIIETHIKKELF